MTSEFELLKSSFRFVTCVEGIIFISCAAQITHLKLGLRNFLEQPRTVFAKTLIYQSHNAD